MIEKLTGDVVSLVGMLKQKHPGSDINLVRPILSECLMGINYYLFDKD